MKEFEEWYKSKGKHLLSEIDVTECAMGEGWRAAIQWVLNDIWGNDKEDTLGDIIVKELEES